MNALRRREITRAVEMLNRVAPLLDEIRTVIDDVIIEEENALDALPESLRDGDRGQAMSNGLDSLREVLDELEELDPAKLVDLLATAAA